MLLPHCAFGEVQRRLFCWLFRVTVAVIAGILQLTVTVVVWLLSRFTFVAEREVIDGAGAAKANENNKQKASKKTVFFIVVK